MADLAQYGTEIRKQLEPMDTKQRQFWLYKLLTEFPQEYHEIYYHEVLKLPWAEQHKLLWLCIPLLMVGESVPVINDNVEGLLRRCYANTMAILVKHDNDQISKYEEAGLAKSIEQIDTDLKKFEVNGYLSFEGREMIKGITNKDDIESAVSNLKKLREKLCFIAGLNPNKEERSTESGQNKLVWKCTPAQAAFIVDIMIDKGYIESPGTSSQGSAKVILSISKFTNHTPSVDSLGKLLHKDNHPIKNQEIIRRFKQLPTLNELNSNESRE